MTDNRVRPPVPTGGDQDKDAGTAFDAVPRDWATTADRRAANAASRFGGSPSNEANYPGDVATLRSGAPDLDDADELDDDGVVEEEIESARVDAAAPADGGGAIVVEDEETELVDRPSVGCARRGWRRSACGARRRGCPRRTATAGCCRTSGPSGGLEQGRHLGLREFGDRVERARTPPGGEQGVQLPAARLSDDPLRASRRRRWPEDEAPRLACCRGPTAPSRAASSSPDAVRSRLSVGGRVEGAADSSRHGEQGSQLGPWRRVRPRRSLPPPALISAAAVGAQSQRDGYRRKGATAYGSADGVGGGGGAAIPSGGRRSPGRAG